MSCIIKHNSRISVDIFQNVLKMLLANSIEEGMHVSEGSIPTNSSTYSYIQYDASITTAKWLLVWQTEISTGHTFIVWNDGVEIKSNFKVRPNTLFMSRVNCPASSIGFKTVAFSDVVNFIVIGE